MAPSLWKLTWPYGHLGLVPSLNQQAKQPTTVLVEWTESQYQIAVIQWDEGGPRLNQGLLETGN